MVGSDREREAVSPNIGRVEKTLHYRLRDLDIVARVRELHADAVGGSISGVDTIDVHVVRIGGGHCDVGLYSASRDKALNQSHELIEDENRGGEVGAETVDIEIMSCLGAVEIVWDSENNIAVSVGGASVGSERLKEGNQRAGDLRVFDIEVGFEEVNEQELVVRDGSASLLTDKDVVEEKNRKIQLGDKGMPVGIGVSEALGVRELVVEKTQHVEEIDETRDNVVNLVELDVMIGEVGDGGEHLRNSSLLGGTIRDRLARSKIFLLFSRGRVGDIGDGSGLRSSGHGRGCLGSGRDSGGSSGRSGGCGGRHGG